MSAICVVDNSVVVAWALHEGDLRADTLLERLRTDRVVAPSVWPLEFSNVLVVAERRGRLSPADVARVRDLVGRLPIGVSAEPPGRALGEILDLARATGLSSYDASYLDLALRLGLPLATLDAKLAAAAGRLGVSSAWD